MNNIEILEEFIKYFEAEATQRKYRRNISITVGEDDIEAIKNLIQENKELKEKQKEYEKQLDLDYVKENYIPKSKIEKALDKINERYMTPEAISNSNGATFNYWTGKRDMCIELLGEN